jgi:hypothetical protein
MNHGSHGNLLFADETFRLEALSRSTTAWAAASSKRCTRSVWLRSWRPDRSRSARSRCFRRALRQTYAADFICFDKIIVELKATSAIAPGHRAQTLNYLRATGLRVGLLINFGASPDLQIERFAL